MPFAGYVDFDDCVARNGDKDDPEAYCATIERNANDFAGCHDESCAPPPVGTGGSFPGPGRSTGVGTKQRPIRTSDVAIAARALQEGKHVVLNSKRTASTLLDELAAKVQAARAAKETPPDINLCNVTVPGSNLFCVENKGIPRVKMPQLSGIPTPGSKADTYPKDADGGVNLGPAFTDYLQSKGIAVQRDRVPAEVLKATQSELVGAKVVGIAGAMERGEAIEGGPIFVTSDDYVVDGHHRWAATVAVGLKGLAGDIDVNVIDSDIITVLAEATRWTTEMGIPPKDTNPNQLAAKLTTLAHRWGRRFQFAGCQDASCAPPPVGTGGSVPGGSTKPKARAQRILAAAGERIPLADLGIRPAPPDLAAIAAAERDDDALWQDVPVTKVSWKDTFYGTEESVKTKHIAKVVEGREPLREGYEPRLYQMGPGTYLIADGHHRLAMHSLLESDAFDVKVRRLDRREQTTAATTAFKFDPSQPRVPAGQSGGGRWTSGPSGSSGAGRWAPTGVDGMNGKPAPPPATDNLADDKIVATPESRALAIRINEHAIRVEPDITRQLAALVGDPDPSDYNGGPSDEKAELYGYEHRLKTPEKIAEKIERVMIEKDVDRDAAADDIKDAVRYTVHFPTDQIGAKGAEVVAALRADPDNDSVIVKNTWPGGNKYDPNEAYRGVNVSVIRKDGAKWELQFHTPTSQVIKDASHKLYEEQRVLPGLKSNPRWASYTRRMNELVAGLKTPERIDQVFTRRRFPVARRGTLAAEGGIR